MPLLSDEEESYNDNVTLPVYYTYDNLSHAKGRLTKVTTGPVTSPFFHGSGRKAADLQDERNRPAQRSLGDRPGIGFFDRVGHIPWNFDRPWLQDGLFLRRRHGHGSITDNNGSLKSLKIALSYADLYLRRSQSSEIGRREDRNDHELEADVRL